MLAFNSMIDLQVDENVYYAGTQEESFNSMIDLLKVYILILFVACMSFNSMIDLQLT